MGPGVDGNLVALVIGALQGRWETDSARADDEEGCLLVVLEEVVVQSRRVRGWSVWVGQSLGRSGCE